MNTRKGGRFKSGRPIEPVPSRSSFGGVERGYFLLRKYRVRLFP